MIKEKTHMYEEETTGSLMTDGFVAVTEGVTVEKALQYLRSQVKDKNNIHYLYIVDESEKLVGVLTIRELLAADGQAIIDDVMVKEVISFPPHIDQEDAAKVFRDTDLVSIPVVNDDKQLIGIIHIEDILDVMQLEATEDIHRMASVRTESSELERA